MKARCQMPSYAKISKENLSNMRKLDDNDTITLTEECSAIIKNISPKLKDMASFSISYRLRNTSVKCAL